MCFSNSLPYQSALGVAAMYRLSRGWTRQLLDRDTDWDGLYEEAASAHTLCLETPHNVAKRCQNMFDRTRHQIGRVRSTADRGLSAVDRRISRFDRWASRGGCLKYIVLGVLLVPVALLASAMPVHVLIGYTIFGLLTLGLAYSPGCRSAYRDLERTVRRWDRRRPKITRTSGLVALGVVAVGVSYASDLFFSHIGPFLWHHVRWAALAVGFFLLCCVAFAVHDRMTRENAERKKNGKEAVDFRGTAAFKIARWMVRWIPVFVAAWAVIWAIGRVASALTPGSSFAALAVVSLPLLWKSRRALV